jgi:hypothetical protein
MTIETNADYRLIEIQAWLNAVLPSSDFEISVASSDASFRRYFRVEQDGSSWIVMDAPPEHEDIVPFVAIAEFLAGYDIHVPKIFAKNLDQGFLLLSDLGSTAYLSVLSDDRADQLYQAAIDEIIKMQLSNVEEISLSKYDKALLNTELMLFPDWFLNRHLSISSPDWLDALFETLINNALEQPQYFVHRDYHSRNLMLVADSDVGVIDFQDAVIGGASYDLVSLLRDVYIEWPLAKQEQWITYYLNQAKQKQLFDTDMTTFMRWFDLMGLHRHLKILGIFCRLNYRDGKSAYMNDLALTLRYVLQVSEKYPELHQLHEFLTQTPEIMAIQ